MDVLSKKCLLFLAVALLCLGSCLCQNINNTSTKASSDTTVAHPSSDTTVAQPSSDTTVAQPSSDTTVAQPSSDTTVAQPSSDTTVAQPSSDTTVAQPSSDTTIAQPSSDTTVAQPSTNSTVVHPSSDTTVAHPSSDTTVVHPSSDTTVAHPSSDTTVAQPSSDTTVVHPSSDTTVAQPSSDTTVAHPSSDTTVAHPSSDTTVAQPSSDTTVAQPSTNSTVEHPSSDSTVTQPSTDSTVPQPSKDSTVTPTSSSVLWSDYKKYSKVGDIVSSLVSPIPFPYFESAPTVINVYGNGYISFNYDYQRPTAPQYTSWTSTLNLFAVYWADIEYSKNDESNFYIFEDVTKLQDANSDSPLINYVKRVVKSNFQPLYAVAVTWVNAMPKPAKDNANDKATFQLILATDSQVSYAIRNYQKVWDNTEVFGRPHFTAAYTMGDGHRSDLIQPGNEWSDVNKLGIETPTSASLECVKQTQAVTPSLRETIKSLPPCPCQEVQAANDPRFYESNSCFLEGDELQQRCCYNDYGLLITNSKEAQVPEIEDGSLQKAYTSCCLGESRLCEWFYQQIPSPSCSAYKAPAYIGAGFGDPHLWTFDGNQYTLNVVGDYVLFKSGDHKVEVQVRIDKSSNSNGTVFIAYAVNVSNVIHQFNIDNNTLVKDNKTTPGRASVKASGFNIIIQIRDSALHHTIILDELDANSVGLFGSLDGNSSNDFKFNIESSISDNPTGDETQRIYNFGSSWNVTGNSMITPPFDASSEPPILMKLPTTVNDTLNLIVDPSKRDEAQHICGDNIFCLQEYFFSGNNESAIRILEHYNTILAQKDLSSENPPSFLNTEAVSTANVTSHLNLKLAVNNSQNVTFNVSSPFNSINGFNLQGDTFTWDVSLGLDNLRKLSYPQELQFYVRDKNGMTAMYTPTINLCLCDKTEQCLISTQDTKKGEVNSLLCNCTGNQGEFCETVEDICKNCFDKNISACNSSKTENYCPNCPQGYKGDGIACYDVDECADKKNGCNYGCTNTLGGSFCYCPERYRPDGKNCTERNECEENYNYCNSSDKVCNNDHGIASCSCIPGLVGDDKCIRAPYVFTGEVSFSIFPSNQVNYSSLLNKHSDEFQELKKIVLDAITVSVKSLGDDMYVDLLAFVYFNNETIAVGNTTGNETFKETVTAKFVYYTSNMNRKSGDIRDALASLTFNCLAGCHFGSIRRTSDSVIVNDDDDLCSIPQINICDKTTTECHHKNNTVHCTCQEGYTVFEHSLYSCTDIDECKIGSAKCAAKSACINTFGSYECNCAKGKVWDGLSKTCIGDKCSLKPCQNDGVCVALYGNEDFTCSCTYGWNGQNCTDEDTDARRWKIAVITVSSILGFSCLALFIVVVVICVKQRKTQPTASSSQYAEIKPLPRVRASQKATYEMEEKSDAGNVYAHLQADSASDKNSPYYSPPDSRSNGTRAVYNNAAFDSDVVERL